MNRKNRPNYLVTVTYLYPCGSLVTGNYTAETRKLARMLAAARLIIHTPQLIDFYTVGYNVESNYFRQLPNGLKIYVKIALHTYTSHFTDYYPNPITYQMFVQTSDGKEIEGKVFRGVKAKKKANNAAYNANKILALTGSVAKVRLN